MEWHAVISNIHTWCSSIICDQKNVDLREINHWVELRWAPYDPFPQRVNGSCSGQHISYHYIISNMFLLQWNRLENKQSRLNGKSWKTAGTSDNTTTNTVLLNEDRHIQHWHTHTCTQDWVCATHYFHLTLESFCVQWYFLGQDSRLRGCIKNTDMMRRVNVCQAREISWILVLFFQHSGQSLWWLSLCNISGHTQPETRWFVAISFLVLMRNLSHG